MAIFDILKKKKKPSKPEPEKKKAVKVEPKKEAKKVQKKEKAVPSPSLEKIKQKRIDLAWKILKSPHVSEKATELTKLNQYEFKVWPRSSKAEIKKAVEDIYKVDVLDVKVMEVSPRKRRLGKITGFKKGYKKAIVKLRKGQKIEILPR